MGMLVKLNDNWAVDADTIVALKVIDRSQEEGIDLDHAYELEVGFNNPGLVPFHIIFNYKYEHVLTERLTELQKEINLARTRA